MKIYNYYNYKTIYFNLLGRMLTIRIKIPVVRAFMFRKYNMYPYGKEFGIHFFKIAMWIQLSKIYR